MIMFCTRRLGSSSLSEAAQLHPTHTLSNSLSATWIRSRAFFGIVAIKLSIGFILSISSFDFAVLLRL